MARRPRRPKNEASDTNAPAPAGTNTFDPAAVEDVVNRLETLAKEIGSEKSEYMLRCRDIRSDIKDVYIEAKDKGIGKAALKAKIKERALRRKVSDCRVGLDGEQIDMFDHISQALRDVYEETPQAGFVPPATSPAPFTPPAAA